MTPPRVIALEEHFTSPGLRALRGEKDTPIQRKLDDLGELRIREMDEAGIDLQVISENNPATQNLDAETAVKLARASNDVLHEAVRRHPDRFGGVFPLDCCVAVVCRGFLDRKAGPNLTADDSNCRRGRLWPN